MHPFEVFLRAHNIEALQLSITAQVRYMTVWNAAKGRPITPDHAAKIRTAVEQLAGTSYAGNIVIFDAQSIEDQPTATFRVVL